MPPNSSGLISAEDIKALQEFKELRNSIFGNNLVKQAHVSASSARGGLTDHQFSPEKVLEEGIFSYWAPDKKQSRWILYFEFKEPINFNVLEVQEPIHMGQRVIEFHLDVLDSSGEWRTVIRGTTVGYRRLLVLYPTVESHYLRLVIDKARAEPLISHVGVYMDSVSIFSHGSTEKRSKKSYISKVLQQVHQYLSASFPSPSKM